MFTHEEFWKDPEKAFILRLGKKRKVPEGPLPPNLRSGEGIFKSSTGCVAWVGRSFLKLHKTPEGASAGLPDFLPEHTRIFRRDEKLGVERWRGYYPGAGPDGLGVRSADNHTCTGDDSYDAVVTWLVETHNLAIAKAK